MPKHKPLPEDTGRAIEEMRARMFDTPDRDHDDPFENAVERALGPAMREDDTLCVELWSALANVDWYHSDGTVAGYTFRQAGSLIAAILGRGHYMNWYCSGPYAVVSDRIADALEAEGWTFREIEG
jgi:hypothetical protein